MDPEVNRYILMNEAKGLVPGYPESMKNILGINVAEVHGAVHKRIRGSLLSLVGPVALRDQVLPKMDKFMRSFLHNWDGKTIDMQQKSMEMAFFVALELVVENEPRSFHQSFDALFQNIYKGTISLPFKIPGSNYYQGLKAREKVDVILKMLLAKRKASSVTYDDNLQQLLENDSNYKLDEEEVIEQIITILYSGYETVSTTTMMAVKYLHDHPKALQAIREEHFNIKQNKRPEELISWDEYKKMNFTRAEKGLESHNYNMLFGAGTRICPGKEQGICKISLFLHSFVTNYRWEVVEDKLLTFPRVIAPNGLHIKVTKY
ncbi:hypothetical protein TanjilG_02417 [Lupinus angustifolius]|uniref:Cytochrome P450 n=1 Tax=Lupinus angustifolius TaxID=3871 RepID=A0A1J7HIJ3_LUPAN|nr:hypothetical protein TanjilG_02417 [Lupinus angustifolius]